MHEEHDAAHEDGAEPLLPADAEGGEAEGEERVLAHVGRDRDRAVRVEAHQQGAEGGGQDRGDGARAGRDAREARGSRGSPR